jgi:competence protein ComEA
MRERPASTIAVWAVAAVLAAIAGARLLGGSDAEPDPPPVKVDAPVSAAKRAGSSVKLYVHVAGAVRRPGLIRVKHGSRVAEAVEKAGGPRRTADLTVVNLAAEVQDGQQIVVPARGAAGAASAASGPAAAPGRGAEAPIHLSTATVDQLDEIDGIGPTLAERIIEYRDSKGGFGSPEELGEVEGIGEKRLETLRTALQP